MICDGSGKNVINPCMMQLVNEIPYHENKYKQ